MPQPPSTRGGLPHLSCHSPLWRCRLPGHAQVTRGFHFPVRHPAVGSGQVPQEQILRAAALADICGFRGPAARLGLDRRPRLVTLVVPGPAQRLRDGQLHRGGGIVTIDERSADLPPHAAAWRYAGVRCLAKGRDGQRRTGDSRRETNSAVSEKPPFFLADPRASHVLFQDEDGSLNRSLLVETWSNTGNMLDVVLRTTSDSYSCLRRARPRPGRPRGRAAGRGSMRRDRPR